jgi:hypothetical protein
MCITFVLLHGWHFNWILLQPFKRLYVKGYKHWHRLQNPAASLSPHVLQLCGISPLSCSHLLPRSDITVYDCMGTRPPYTQHSTNTKTTHTYIHTCKVCSKSFWAYYIEHNTHHINFIKDRSLQNSPLLYNYNNSKDLSSFPKISYMILRNYGDMR